MLLLRNCGTRKAVAGYRLQVAGYKLLVAGLLICKRLSFLGRVMFKCRIAAEPQTLNFKQINIEQLPVAGVVYPGLKRCHEKPAVQVSDTTGDAMKPCNPDNKNYFRLATAASFIFTGYFLRNVSTHFSSTTCW